MPPSPVSPTTHVNTPVLQGDTWHRLDAVTRYQRVELCHDGMAQRWLVVSSQASCERATATVSKAQRREYEATEKQLFHLQARRFETSQAATAALAAVAKRWTYHQVDAYTLREHNRYGRTGRPPIKAIEWQIQGHVRPDVDGIERRKPFQACFGLGTNLDERQVSDAEVIRAYQGQGQAEGGFRFLKDPLFFVSSLFVKKPSRIQGLLTVMTIALLVYSVAQRRLRQQLARYNTTVPNQINQPTQRPTLRWVFQLLEGIHRVRVLVQGQVHDLIEGLNDVKINLLRWFGEGVCRLYQISPG